MCRWQQSLCLVLALSLAACGGGDGGGAGSSSNTSSSSTSSSSSSSSSSSVDPEISGLDARPENNICLAGPAPAPETEVELARRFDALSSFDSAVALLQAPQENSHWYLLEQSGRIWRFANEDEVQSASLFADLRERVDDSSVARESGLLSMAFHPDYADNREVYLFYQVSKDASEPDCCVSRLVRYRVNDSGTSLLEGSAEVLLSFTPPFENHFGGRVGFGEDGYLYLSLGDGGSAGDPGNRAQTTSNLMGSIIRLDVDGGSPYAIPPDNPFADQSGFLCRTDALMEDKAAAGGDCPEIYAWGLRNPWRWSFDRATGELWLADVGQSRWEEVNRIERGGNYGWRLREGAHCYDPSEDCPTDGLIDPVAEVPQDSFQSITGGVVYRGSEVPTLAGKYLFGDYITRRFYAVNSDGSSGAAVEPLIENTGLNIASFAEDRDGEVYLLDYGGEIHQVVTGETGDGTANAPARWLADTGCVNPDDPREPAEGLIPYDLNAPFWSDGADKQRWMALPDGQQIAIGPDGDWQLPEGSVLIKHFYLNEALIETRLFKHHLGGQWAGTTYAWNEAGTAAERVEGGRVTEVQEQSWIYPSGAECLQCHTEAAGRSLGLETAQLNRDSDYPETGRTRNQLDTLHAVGVLASEPGDDRIADPYADRPLNELTAQARAYLHTNCSQCHRTDGPTNLNMDLRVGVSLPEMNVCDVEPQGPDSDIAGARRLAPGDAGASILVERMQRRGHALQMPPVGSAREDTQGVDLISDWIDSLNAGDCSP